MNGKSCTSISPDRLTSKCINTHYGALYLRRKAARHVRRPSDNGVQLRQIQLRVVDKNGNRTPNAPSVAESDNPAQAANSYDSIPGPWSLNLGRFLSLIPGGSLLQKRLQRLLPGPQPDSIAVQAGRSQH